MAADPEQSKGDTPSPLPTESTSTLTREGSLTPQWMQPKGTAGGVAISGMQHATRPRIGGESERQPDSARRGRSESLGGNEAVLSKPRELERARSSKWAPDDRESWKPKERWANGPDSSRKWLDVQTAGRQKQGWGTGDALSRSHGDRWNTDGGRWTEDRRMPEERDYVPKNARWNDEERAERWRTTGGRGEGATRGRGGQARGQGGRRVNADSQDLNGVHAVEHGMRKCKLDDGRTRYNKKDLLFIRDALQAKMGSDLALPRGVDTSYQYLFRSDKKLPEDETPPIEKEVPATVPKPAPSPEVTEVEGIGPYELEADSWVYKDPVGQVQGPFSKQEVLAWWEEGYFPDDLSVQSQLSAKENWVPLEKLLKLWKVPLESKHENSEVPPGVLDPSRKLEQCDSLATVGSHISSTLLAEANADSPEEAQLSQSPPMTMQNVLQSFQSEAHPQQPQPLQFQNPVSDMQTMQNLLLQRQKQNQQVAASLGGLNYGGGQMGGAGGQLGGAGLTGMRPGMPFQQNNMFMGHYGMQQQRPTGLQENTLLTPGILEALQQRVQAQQQTLGRTQLQQPSQFGLDLNSGFGNQVPNQLQGNPNLIALLNQSQAAQRSNEQRNTMQADLQRLLQAKSMQAQNNSFGGMNNPLSAGMFGGMRPPYMQQRPQPNPWANQLTGGYNALSSLLQQRPPQQQMNLQQQQLAQAMLLNKLQETRFPNQQLGMNRPVQSRESLLPLGAMPGGDTSIMDALGQQRQRHNMSPPQSTFQSGVDPNFTLTGQSGPPSSLPPFNYPNQRQPPFPQHILQQLTARPEANVSAPPELNRLSCPPVLSLDPTPASEGLTESQGKTSPPAEQKGKMNAWGMAPTPTNAASLLEIQEQESKSAQQNASKEKQAQVSGTGPAVGGGWNIPHVKPTSLADIMQEDAESKRQAQVKQQVQQPATKEGTVWSKKTTGRGGSQTLSGGESGKGNALRPTEQSTVEDNESGFWNLTSSGPTDNSRDGAFSHDTTESDVQLFSGQLKISLQFREWCKANMVELGGSGDIALIEFLLSLKSRSEIADYIQEYFKEAPPDKLSVFISEFLKRKESDAGQLKKERGNQKSKKKSSKSKESTRSSANPVELDTVSSGASESHGLEATGSGKTATSRTRDAKSKPKAKKQTKGQHIPADMLGFKSNVNFDSLYRGNSNG